MHEVHEEESRAAVRDDNDDGGLEQIMVVGSLSFREVFSSRMNRLGTLGGECGSPPSKGTLVTPREQRLTRKLIYDERHWRIRRTESIKLFCLSSLFRTALVSSFIYIYIYMSHSPFLLYIPPSAPLFYVGKKDNWGNLRDFLIS